jgi:hypothetical protein
MNISRILILSAVALVTLFANVEASHRRHFRKHDRVHVIHPLPQFDHYVATNLGSKVNASSNDFGGNVSVDDNTIFFVSDRPGGIGLEDFWVTTRTGSGDSDWSAPINVTDLNTSGADGAISVTADGMRTYFATSRNTSNVNDVNIWSGIYVDGSWRDIQKVEAPINTTGWESQPSISADGKTLYFASNRAGKIGGESPSNVDLFVSHMQPDSSWSTPVNLGSKINSAKYEASPFITTDGQTLYFCSDGHGGMGGLDLFQSTRLGPTDTDWRAPVALPTPINSTANDFFFCMPATGSRVYFTSDRAGGKGKFDLYVASPASSSVKSSRAAKRSISISPNPCRHNATVHYAFNDDRHRRFSIESLTGATVIDLGDQLAYDGTLFVNVNLLPSGVYLFVATSSDGERDVQRLVVMK